MRLLPLLFLPIMMGCFRDESKIPQYHSKQEVDVAVDSVICYSPYEDFENFILSCSAPNDSLQWHLGPPNVGLLGSGQPFHLQNAPFGWDALRCLAFLDSDTTVYNLKLYYCATFIYIPTVFSPNQDGINENWAPIYQHTYADGEFAPYSIHWEIRTLDGIKIFKADELLNQSWDGTYNGVLMPSGSYLYYIELKIEGEEPVEYTGWLEMLG